MPAEYGDLLDVRVGVRNRRGNFCENARLIFGVHLYLAQELTIYILFPANGNPFFRLFTEITEVAAAIPVDHDAPAGAQVSHNVVAGNRVTALGVADDHTLGAGNDEAGGRGLAIAFLVDANQEARSQRRQPLPSPSCSNNSVRVLESEFVEGLAHTDLADFAKR